MLRPFTEPTNFDCEYWNFLDETVGEWYVDKLVLPGQMAFIPIHEFTGDQIHLLWVFRNSEGKQELVENLGVLTLEFK